MILLIDNYDSFVHNLARYFQRLGFGTHVVRNDAWNVDDIRRAAPEAVIISPGPLRPCEAGCSVPAVRQLAGTVPILGICLGHQAIVEALGGRVIRAAQPVHGRSSLVRHDGRGVFSGLPNPLRVARYHSLIADPASLPDSLEVTCVTDDGVVMGVRHRAQPVVGLQFHPESILTECGYEMLAGFLRIAGLAVPPPYPSVRDECCETVLAPLVPTSGARAGLSF